MLTAKTVIDEGLQLKPEERCIVIDALVESMEAPDKEIDDLWKNEIESRVTAYETGKMETVSLEEVMAKYNTK